MKLNKSHILLVTMVMLATVFMGCSSNEVGVKSSSAEEEYPQKDLNLVVPFNPGGASDLHTRILEKYFEDEFGHSLQFEYKPGAAGAVGSAEVASKVNEDHTIMAANFPDIVIQPLTETGNFSFEDFQYIAEVTNNPLILAANNANNIETLEGLVDKAKESPGEISIGYAPNSVLHIALLDFMDKAGIDVTLVPYKDGAEAKSMLVGDHVDAAMVNLSLMAEELDKINTLAVTTEERSDQYPDMQTFTEQGYDITAELSRIYVAPKGVSDNQLSVLREGFANIADTEGYRNDMEQSDQPVSFLKGEELEEKIQEYSSYAKDIVEEHGLNN